MIFFGNIETYKGLDILAEALERLYNEQYRVQLTIMGKGNMGDVCPKIVNLAIAHADQIKLINSYQPYATIISAVKASKAVVLPYTSSTGTNTLPIAYRYKKPVIATYTGCFQNNVIEGKTGLLVPPNNSIELAKAIKNIIDDPTQTQHMGEEAYEYFNNHFKQSYITQKILEICQEIC